MLQNRNISLFVINDFVSQIGNSIFSILIMWYVYETTTSAIATALIGSFTHISAFFIGPIAGVYADRSKNPKSVFSWILRFNSFILIIMVICIYILSNEMEIFAVFVLVAIRNISFDFLYPVQTRVIPLIVPKDSVTKLLGYRSVSGNISSLLGNAVSGFVISLVGIIGGLILNSITFFLSSILISLLKLIQSPQSNKVKDLNSEDCQGFESKKMGLKKELLEGSKVLWNNDSLRKITIISCLLNVVSMVGPMIVVYFNSYLNASSTTYGVFNAMITLGSIISGAIIGLLVKKHNNSTIVLFGWSLLSIIFFFMALNKVIWIIFVLGLLLGICLTLPNIILNSVQILIIPDEYRGRVSTLLQAVSVVLIPVSNFLGGIIADNLGANYVFLFCGLWQFLVVLIVYKNRELFNIQSTETETAL